MKKLLVFVIALIMNAKAIGTDSDSESFDVQEGEFLRQIVYSDDVNSMSPEEQIAIFARIEQHKKKVKKAAQQKIKRDDKIIAEQAAQLAEQAAEIERLKEAIAKKEDQ